MPTDAELPPDARCPRCGGGFACGAASGHCVCFGLHLSEALRAELATRYSDCLCLPCLRELVAIDTSANATG